MSGEEARRAVCASLYPSFSSGFGERRSDEMRTSGGGEDAGSARLEKGPIAEQQRHEKIEKAKETGTEQHLHEKVEKNAWGGYPSFETEAAISTIGSASTTTFPSEVRAPPREKVVPSSGFTMQAGGGNKTPGHVEPGMTNAELQAKRRAIELEMREYQARLDHVGLALAGQTPHQIEMRAIRDEERAEREKERLHAREELTQFLLERRLHRQAERELKLRRRHSSLPPPDQRLSSVRTRSGSEDR